MEDHRVEPRAVAAVRYSIEVHGNDTITWFDAGPREDSARHAFKSAGTLRGRAGSGRRAELVRLLVDAENEPVSRQVVETAEL